MRHNTLYLSLHQTRALGGEFPVGNPKGGAAYGLREMPVVAIVGAAFSVSAGLSALAVGVAASSTLMAVAGGLMVAGGVLTVAGVVTGNEKLTKVGGIMSMVGGVGNLAIGTAEAMAGGASIGEALSTSAGQMSDAAQYGFGKVGESVSNFFGGGESGVTGGITEAGAPATNIADAGTGIAPTDNMFATDVGGAGANGNLIQTQGIDGGIAPAVDSGIAPQATSVPPAGQVQTAPVNPAGANAAGKGGFLSGAAQFTKDNPMLSYGMMQGVSSMFAPDPNEAQMDVYNDQIKRANDFVVMINPNSPNAEKEYQAAIAAGKKVVVAGYQAPTQPQQPKPQQQQGGFLNNAKTRIA